MNRHFLTISYSEVCICEDGTEADPCRHVAIFVGHMTQRLLTTLMRPFVIEFEGAIAKHEHGSSEDLEVRLRGDQVF